LFETALGLGQAAQKNDREKGEVRKKAGEGDRHEGQKESTVVPRTFQKSKGNIWDAEGRRRKKG